MATNATCHFGIFHAGSMLELHPIYQTLLTRDGLISIVRYSSILTKSNFVFDHSQIAPFCSEKSLYMPNIQTFNLDTLIKLEHLFT